MLPSDQRGCSKQSRPLASIALMLLHLGLVKQQSDAVVAQCLMCHKGMRSQKISTKQWKVNASLAMRIRSLRIAPPLPQQRPQEPRRVYLVSSLSEPLQGQLRQLRIPNSAADPSSILASAACKCLTQSSFSSSNKGVLETHRKTASVLASTLESAALQKQTCFRAWRPSQARALPSSLPQPAACRPDRRCCATRGSTPAR